jgi:hypothetical protein
VSAQKGGEQLSRDANAGQDRGIGPVELLNLRFSERLSQKRVDALENPSRRRILRALSSDLVGPGLAPTAQILLHLGALRSLAIVNFHLQHLLRADLVVREGKMGVLGRPGSREFGYLSNVHGDERVRLALKTTELLDRWTRC